MARASEVLEIEGDTLRYVAVLEMIAIIGSTIEEAQYIYR
jgi:hypothetical protein